jgi:2-haloacid dehalogenase
VSTPKTPNAVVFDLGGVLIRWDPRHLYRQLMPEDEIDAFLDEVGFHAWNHEQDAGAPWGPAVEEHAALFPHRRELLAAYPARFAESLDGPVEGTVAILQELHAAGTRLVALTNWSAELFPHAEAAFDFLALFEGIVVSGREGLAKPDPAVFDLLLSRYHLDPARTVFVDDSPANVTAAAAAGLRAVTFTGPDRLRADLSRLGLLDGAGSG